MQLEQVSKRLVILCMLTLCFLISCHRSLQEKRKQNVKQTSEKRFLQEKRAQNVNQTPGLLFLTPRNGGFNNQRITIYEMIHCAKLLKRRLVVPPIYENVRQDTSSGEGPFPFTDYFDVKTLSRIVDVVTPEELESTKLPCKSIIYCSSPHMKAHPRRLPRILKNVYKPRFRIELEFDPHIKESSKAPCVDDCICRGINFHKVFGKYSDYSMTGQGYSILRSETLWNIRAALRPSRTVVDVANSVIQQIGMPFNAMHVRRGDFEAKCNQLPALCREYGSESFMQSSKRIIALAKKFKNPHIPIFISTTHSSECKKIFKKTAFRVLFMEDFRLPGSLAWTRRRVDVISFASQVVASRSREFVGNRFSSYTSEINSMRLLNRSDTPLVFF